MTRLAILDIGATTREGAILIGRLWLALTEEQRAKLNGVVVRYEG